jgi:hypothetical protein
MANGIADRAMKISSILSIITTFLLILVFYMRQQLLKKNFFRIVLHTVICDFFASFSGLVGLQAEGDPEWKCYFQYFISNYFMLAAHFFSMIIIIELYCTVVKGKPLHNYKMPVLICLTVPVVVTLLPLTTDDIGPNNPEGDWCFISSNPHSPRWTSSFWILVSHYIWVWAIIVLMTFVFISVYLKSRKATSERMQSMIVDSMKKLALYPLITTLAWTPVSYCDTYWAVYGEYSRTCSNSNFIFVACYGFPYLTGALTVTIFVLTNKHIFLDLLKDNIAWVNFGGNSSSLAEQSTSPASCSLEIRGITSRNFESDDKERNSSSLLPSTFDNSNEMHVIVSI